MGGRLSDNSAQSLLKSLEDEMVAGRSPAYPYIDLEKAVAQVNKIHAIAKGHAVNIDSLFRQLGFNGMTGSSKKILAALKYFGLLDQPHGSKEAKLSERSMHIIHGVQGSKEQKDAIKQAFLAPAIYRYCWEQWGNDEIADEVMKSHLILQKGFNDSTVMGFIAGYKQSRSFAGIAEVEEAEDEVNAIPAVKVGDFIQWESQGVLQFPNPVKIREVNEADGYVFVDGSATGIPIDEVSISEPQTQNINSSAPVSGTPPQTAPPVGANMRQETFTLSDSEILIQFPSTMSEEDFEDLEGWLEIFKRKVKRSISS